MRRPPSLLLALLVLSFLAACGTDGNGSDTPASADAPGDRSVATTAPSPPTTSTVTTATSGAPDGEGPRIVSFEVPPVIECELIGAVVPVRFETDDTTTVAFAVDGVSDPGPASPPLSGAHQLSLPCDGNAHTILLVAVGPRGQTVGTRAVRTAPTG